MTKQLKTLSPPRLCSKRTLITTSSISHELIQPNNKSQVSVCVVHLFSFSCLRDIMRKQVLTLTLNQLRKVLSSFHIREVRIILIVWNLSTLGELQNFYWCLETTPSRGKLGSAAPSPRVNGHLSVEDKKLSQTPMKTRKMMTKKRLSMEQQRKTTGLHKRRRGRTRRWRQQGSGHGCHRRLRKEDWEDDVINLDFSIHVPIPLNSYMHTIKK